MDHKHQAEFFAIVSPGLEGVCARELGELGVADLQIVGGGVTFTGRLADLYCANLQLRTASRVVVRLARFRCRAFPELYREAVRLPWGTFLRAETSVNCRVTCRNSRLIHTGRVAATLQEAIDRALGRSAPPPGGGEQLLLARIVDDTVELSIDSSGDLLHRRGYRTSVAAAPLRETLAAGILSLLGWDGREPLADPMCGTGTFLLEGALLAAHRAPGLHRPFAFMNWPGYRPGLWEQQCGEARREERPWAAAIAGGDADAGSLAAARDNLAKAGLQEIVTLDQRPLAEQPVHSGAGLVICNPPYGKRLTPEKTLPEFYAALGRDLARAYPRWRKALLCPEARLAQATGLALRQVAELDNGGLRIGLYATKAGAGD